MSISKRLLGATIGATLFGATYGAGAVTVNPRGTGQVLLFPYYTVNGGNQTLVTVVNTTGDVKAVRVRFREGYNSRDVLNFNVYLAAYDAWVAAIASVPGQDAAQLVTNDVSCTVPRLDTLPPAQLQFRNYHYTGVEQDFPSSLAAEYGTSVRTREGHVEMIEMGLLRTGTGATQLAEEVSLLAVGQPPADCEAPRLAWLPPAGAWVVNGARDILAPTGGLAGNAAIVDVADGTMVSYAAVALVDFYTDGAAPGALHSGPGTEQPNLAAANNGGGSVFADVDVDGVGPVREVFPAGARGVDAVSLTLMRSTLSNDFVADPSLGAATEWVVTFPTRGHYADSAQLALPPFSNPFQDDGRSREAAVPSLFDREARPWSFDPGCGIIGLPPPECQPPNFTLDYSVNVLAFPRQPGATTTPIFGATIDRGAKFIDVAAYAPLTTAGWFGLDFSDPQQRTFHDLFGASTGRTYRGLPTIGFSATRIVNTAARPGLIANYAGAQPHRGTLEGVIVDASPETREPKP